MSETLCKICQIILNAENKTNGKRLCKPCNSNLCKEYKKKNKELISSYNKQYKLENKKIISKYNKEYHEANKETIYKRHNENMKIRRKNDPEFKLSQDCRNRINKVLKNKTSRTFELLDCNKSFLKKWLEYNFAPGMNFENHGPVWHMDHVIPCAKFDLTVKDEIKHCFRWTNIRPLWANENIVKNDKIDKNYINNHYETVKKFANSKSIILPEFDYTKYF
jgi:hypothetical protein